MESNLLIGLAGLAVLIALIAIRMPIAYAMILVGGVGASILTGPAIILSQLKDLAYAQFAIYDLSVVPMFVLMGNIATRSGLSSITWRSRSSPAAARFCISSARSPRSCNRGDCGSGCARRAGSFRDSTPSSSRPPPRAVP